MTLSAAIQLQDRISQPLLAITRALNIVIASFEEMNRASANPINTSGFESARGELAEVGAQLRHVQEQIDNASRRQGGLNDRIRGAGDEIQRAEEQQRRYNSEISRGQQLMEGIVGKAKALIGAYISIQSIKKGIEFVQNSMKAYDVQREAEERLTEIMRTRMQATDDVIESVKQLASEQQKIGVIGDEVQMFGAQQLATFLSSPEALEKLMPSMNNLAVHVNGVEVSTQEMKQIGNMMGKGMQGQVAALQRAGVTMKEYQADIIKNGDEMERAAMLAEVITENTGHMNEVMANTPIGVITQIKNEWGDYNETVGGKLYPSVLKFFKMIQQNISQAHSLVIGLATVIAWIISIVSEGISILGDFANYIKNNWASIEPFVSEVGNNLKNVLGTALYLGEIVLNFVGHALVFLASIGNVIYQNWSIIEPVLLGVAAAMGVYLAVTKGAAVATTIFTAVQNAATVAVGLFKSAQTIVSIGYGVLTGSTSAASAATLLFNSALMACPLTWIVLLIIAVITVIYVAVAAFNRWKGTSISATGIIGGAIFALGAVVYNVIAYINNLFTDIANFIGNCFKDPIGAVKVMFLDMADTVIGYILNMASTIESIINKIPGVQVDITSGLDNFKNNLSEIAAVVKNEMDWVEYYKKMDYKDIGAAAHHGYDAGNKLKDNVKSFFSFDKEGQINDMLSSGSGSSLDPSMFDGLADGIDDIAGNTDKIAKSDALNRDSNDMELVRNIAERTYMDKTIQIKVEMQNNNSIHSELDIDGVISTMVGKIEEQLPVMAEGVHI